MTTAWPSVPLDEVLKLDLDAVTVVPGTSYEMVGVDSYGRGLFVREPVSGEATSYRRFYRLRADHFVMSQLFGWEGALARSTEEHSGRYVSPQFPTFACVKERLDLDFLTWFARRRPFWDELGSRATGMGDRRRTLNPAALLGCVIPLPSLPEQRRIVSRIEELAGKVGEVRGLVVQTSAASDALVLSELDRVCGALKSQFGGERLANLTVDASYGTSAKCATDRQPGDVGVLRIPNVAAESINLTEMKYTRLTSSELERLALKQGDLLVVRTNGSRDLVGHCAVVSSLPEPAAFASYLIRVRLDDSRMRPDFAQRMMKKLRVDGTLVDFARTTAGQYNVSLGRLREAMLAVPPLEEQDRIVARLDALQAKADELTRLQTETRAELDALLPSILDRAFKGGL